MSSRFSKGDHIIVRDAKDGRLLAEGTALQSRGFFGAAMFQVQEESLSDWVNIVDFNLNYVDVEVQ